jgi:hypothetical protein
LNEIATQSRLPAHRKQVAENQHRWAVAVARATRDDRASRLRPSSNTPSNSSPEGGVEGLLGADRLLEAAEATYTDLQACRKDAAGCCLARGVLAHRSGRLRDAVAHLERAQANWAGHDAAAAAATANGATANGATAKGTTSARDSTDAASASEGADRAECARLLAAWTQDLKAADAAAEVDPHASKEVSATHGGLKRQTAGTAVGAGSGTAAPGEAGEVAANSSFWELVELLDARYGRKAFALLVFAMTAAFALVFSVLF